MKTEDHKTMLRWLWLSVAVLILDQLSKLAVVNALQLYESVRLTSFLRLTYVHNTGAAFSLLSDAGGWQRWLFTVLAVAISAFLIGWLIRLKQHEILMATALSLVLGGAVGNLIDRVAYGYVIDFIDVHYQAYHWPAFNVADSAICIGVVLMLLENTGLAKSDKHSTDP